MNTEKLHKTNFTILWICAGILITFLTISRGLTQQTIISDGGMLICMLIVTGLYFFKRLGDVVRGTGMTVIIAIGCILVSVSEGGNSACFVLSYIPLGMQDEMLREAGYSDWTQLYEDVPESVLLKDGVDLPGGLSELDVTRVLRALASENVRFEHIFRGAGAYRHFIPAIVGRVARKESFVTAYTPYQAEISQGILQSIFEYQSMICTLTGMR